MPLFYQSKCFVNEVDAHVLVTNILQHLEEVTDSAYKLLSNKFASVTEQITRLEMLDLNTRFDEYLKQLPVISFNSEK